MAAVFYELDVKAGLKNKRKLSAFLNNMVTKYRPDVKKVQLSYIFCTDKYLLQINKQFLDHDTYTDIITFDLSESSGPVLIGEIYVSIERVKENAIKYDVQFADELHRVIFHGALHLCGFKDKKNTDKKIMRAREEDCLTLYKKDTI